MENELNNIKWGEFKISDLFTVSTGSLISKEQLIKGTVPRITATENNNGISGFYKTINTKNYREVSNFISVSFLGSVFYHPYLASLDMKIHAIQLKDRDLNKYIAEFLILCLKQTVSIYSYGDQLSSTDLPKKIILLPLSSSGDPDYEFMENYMRQKEQKKINAYRNYISQRLSELESSNEIVPLSEKGWEAFEISEIFNINAGKRLTKADMKKGDKPFIGATEYNNGITEYVSNTNSSEDFNVLGVNYNGSVVENFYHPYVALFSDDVKRLSFKTVVGNRYLYLFAKTQILKQKSKYQYGYKFNGTRMDKQKIMLPINSNREPDYEYMESYMKMIEYKKLLNYRDIKVSNTHLK